MRRTGNEKRRGECKGISVVQERVLCSGERSGVACSWSIPVCSSQQSVQGRSVRVTVDSVP